MSDSSIIRRPRAALVDLDNCISHDSWRQHLCEMHHPQPNDRYWAYHEECHHDLFMNRSIIDMLKRDYAIIIATSRPERVREKTEVWLRNNGIGHVMCLMRPDDNQEPSTILKARHLDAARKAGFYVHVAIDDRVDVLEMYADEGVPVVQRVFIHSQENRHP